MNTVLSTPQRALPTEAEMKKAVYNSDSGYDGIFFVAVKSTNIFCRPSCRARKPHEKNIVFYGSVHDALFAGFRPCKRCKPLESAGAHPDWVKRLLERIDKEPTVRVRDGELRKMGIDPARARRYFQKSFGMTFHAYARGRRLGTAFSKIREGNDLDDVILSNGYESHSGFREAFSKTFGKPPGKLRAADCIITSMYESPLGPIIIGATSEGVCMVEFSDRRMLEFQFKALHRHFKCAIIPGRNEHTEQIEDELKEYFEGNLSKFKTKLVYPGTDFQQKVWNDLQKIPYGKTISYEELAVRVGVPKASRAVGTANGMNRIAIVIPCHRVVNKGGKLGGYGGGLWRKQWLLDMERREIAKYLNSQLVN
jgi:AraC family transcriptional regulator of adaptative response/methylated-DNA-[protein]-cysteine methyltransferase